MRVLSAIALALMVNIACAQTQHPDVIFVPTPQEVVDRMLEMAKVGKGDVLYDLGSGDGRIPVTAAKQYREELQSRINALSAKSPPPVEIKTWKSLAALYDEDQYLLKQGVTEGNLEKILKLLRSMWPVGVIIDEADAFLGDRNQQGDSGTSNRVFAQLSNFMGNTAYRGKIDFITISLDDLADIDKDVPKFLSEMKAEMPAYLLKTTDEDAAMKAVTSEWAGNP